MIIRLLGAASAVACLSACATVARGTTELVHFQSNPPGAIVSTTEGLTCAVTPCAIKVDRKRDFVATFSLPGYHPHQVYVGTFLPGEGAAAVAGNVLLGGVVGIATDAVTGAGLDHKPNPVDVMLIPLEEPPPPPAVKPPPRQMPASVDAPVS